MKDRWTPPGSGSPTAACSWPVRAGSAAPAPPPSPQPAPGWPSSIAAPRRSRSSRAPSRGRSSPSRPTSPSTAPAPASSTEVLERLGGLDVLLHAVGINDRRPILDFTEDEWERILTVNLSTLFGLAQAAGRHMVARRSGRVLALSSVSGLLAHHSHGALRGLEGRHQPAAAGDGARVGAATASRSTRSRPATSRRRSPPTTSRSRASARSSSRRCRPGASAPRRS